MSTGRRAAHPRDSRNARNPGSGCTHGARAGRARCGLSSARRLKARLLTSY